MFWNSPFTGTSGSKGQNPPFLLAQTLTGPSPFVPALSFLSGMAPATPLTGGSSRSSFDPNFRDGYAQQWNVSVQHQLMRDYLVEIGYVGSRGRQLVLLVDVNQAPAQFGVTNPNINRPSFHVNPALASVIQSTSRGTLDYHALQARFARRFSGRLSFQNSYTYGKAIDLDSETDGFSRFPDSSNVDITAARLPTTSGTCCRRTGSTRSLSLGTAGLVAGRFAESCLYARAIHSACSSLSIHCLTVTIAAPGQLYRPDRIGSGRVENPTIDRWFAVEDFVPTSEPTATFGNSGRNILRGTWAVHD